MADDENENIPRLLDNILKRREEDEELPEFKSIVRDGILPSLMFRLERFRKRMEEKIKEL